MMKKCLLFQPKLIITMVCFLNMACQELEGQPKPGDGILSDKDTVISQTVHDITKAVPTGPTPVDTVEKTVNTWRDSLIIRYIQKTDHSLIRALANRKEHVEWVYDNTRATDSATYYIFSVGHTVKDEDGQRYVAAGWIYLDSARQRLYEFDVAEERLKLWNGERQ